MSKQLELDAVPRRRVQLVADEPVVPKTDEADGYVFHRPGRRLSELKVQLVADEPAVPLSRGERRAQLKLYQEAKVIALDLESSHAMKRAVNAVGQKAAARVLEPMTHAQDVEAQYASQEITHDEADAKLGELTDWTEGVPPCTGWWDTHEQLVNTDQTTRLWFDAVGQQWRTVQGSWLALEHLPKGFIWRGLTQPAEQGYSYSVPGTIARQRGFYARGHRVELKES